jgi:hypothetical protein
MKPQDINEAIGKDLGWVQNFPPGGRILLPYKWYNSITKEYALDLPNYALDLNAMHEAERWGLDDDQLLEYLLTIKGMSSRSGNIGEQIWAMCALPTTRSEAYLRVKGLWREVAE